MAEYGVALTREQADALGDEGMDWLSKRLGLKIKTTDTGVIAKAQK
jgi:hypothetical protein